MRVFAAALTGCSARRPSPRTEQRGRAHYCTAAGAAARHERQLGRRKAVEPVGHQWNADQRAGKDPAIEWPGFGAFLEKEEEGARHFGPSRTHSSP